MTPILLQDRAEVGSNAKLDVTHGSDIIAMVGGSTMDCDGFAARDIKVGLEAMRLPQPRDLDLSHNFCYGVFWRRKAYGDCCNVGCSGVRGHEAKRWSYWCGALGYGVGRQSSGIGRRAMGWIAWA